MGAMEEWLEGRREAAMEEKLAGTVPEPVASRMAGSACFRSHSTVSPSVLCPSSRVNWNTRAAHIAGIRILRPRPSTFVCRSLLGGLFAAAAATAFFSASGTASAVDEDDGCPPAAAGAVIASEGGGGGGT